MSPKIRESQGGSALGLPEDIIARARIQPELVYCLLYQDIQKARGVKGNRLGDVLPIRDLATGLAGWDIINLKGRFVNTAAEQIIQIRTDDMPCVDSWVKSIRYTVRRTNFAAGSLFKGESDYYNARNPNIDISMQFRSYCTTLLSTVSGTPTPLENFACDFECHCPGGIILGQSAKITGELVNRRAFVNEEVPVEVVISLHVLLLGRNYGGVSRDEAIAGLAAIGILPEGG